MYKDQGYLFFRVVPVELNIDNDSIDVEMRIFEGKPATYNNIIISGNNVSNEKIIRRQVFTRPGYLFSQTELERSIREIATMGHFDQEAIMQMGTGFNVVPNQVNNTVDIIYNVTEKPDSQFEIAGGGVETPLWVRSELGSTIFPLSTSLTNRPGDRYHWETDRLYH